MKVLFSIIIIFTSVLFPSVSMSQEIKARILYSNDSVPVEFASVKLIRNDSVPVDVTLTDEEGYFRLNASISPTAILEISAVGCLNKKVTLPCDSVIYLDSSSELSEVIVRACRKYARPTSRGITVSMTDNPVAKLGTAAEALKQLPLIDSSGGKISILGFGTPLIYINNRLVRDMNELSILSATDIKNVEIITNPSAQYGADVTSVIIIHTKKTDSGFHSVINGKISASEKWSESGDITLNYHTNQGLTLFGDVSYGFSGFRQSRYYSERFYSTDNPSVTNITDTYATAQSRSQSLITDAGLNYDFGKNSLGFKYTFSRTPKSKYSACATSSIDVASLRDEINSISELSRQNSTHHVNAFGSFTMKSDIKLRIDADFVNSWKQSNSNAIEHSKSQILTHNYSKGTLWSGKIILSKMINTVEIEAGTELSHTHNNQKYDGSSSNGVSFLKPESDDVKQNLQAGFISFDWSPNEKWNLYGGIRLESTNTTFQQNDYPRKDLSKTYYDWLPNIGVTLTSPVRITMYYRGTVSRPNYQLLDNTYIYVTPTLWETGNPTLLPTLRHRIGVNISFKKFILQSSFTINRRNIAYSYTHDIVNNINIDRPVNLPKYNSLQVVGVQQLDFSFWHPTLQGVLYFQNLKYGNPSRKYHTPLYTLSLNNRFDIPGGIYAYFNIFKLGTGNQDLTYSNGTWQMSVTFNKTWRNWTFTLSANDFLNTWRQRFDIYTNTMKYASDIKGASRSISLSVRYSFNKAKGAYKGKISRQDEIDRLQ